MSFCCKISLVSELRIGSDNSDEAVNFAPWNKTIEFRSVGPLSLSPSWMTRLAWQLTNFGKLSCSQGQRMFVA